MKVIYDNIIFSLQRVGGISVVWNELLQRARQDAEIHLTELETKHRWLERYRDPVWNGTEKSVFHSSYFRIIDQPAVRNISTIHDLTYHYYRHGLARRVHLWQEASALNHSAAVVCVSESTRKDVLRLYPKLPEKKIHVVYNGVSERFVQHECTNPTPYESQGYLLYVGNRSAGYKNFDCAVKVAQQVKMPLVIVGDALTLHEQAYLQEQLGGTMFYEKAYASQDELIAVYNHAFCLLYPSAYEGFGLPIIEAQRTRCIVLAQAVSSIPEVMGRGGICVPPQPSAKVLAQTMTESIRDMLNGRTDVDLLREEGWTNSQRFSWEKSYKQMKQIYRMVNEE